MSDEPTPAPVPPVEPQPGPANGERKAMIYGWWHEIPGTCNHYANARQECRLAAAGTWTPLVKADDDLRSILVRLTADVLGVVELMQIRADAARLLASEPTPEPGE